MIRQIDIDIKIALHKSIFDIHIIVMLSMIGYCYVQLISESLPFQYTPNTL